MPRCELLLHVARQVAHAADDLEADVVAQEGVELHAEVVLQQAHEGLYLGRRPLPVLDREGVEGQHLEAEAGRGLDHVAHRVDACAVALHPALVA